MTRTLTQIEDYYLNQRLKGETLRNALEADKEYQRLLKIRKSIVRNKYNVTEEEEKVYLLPNEDDYEILSIVKTLEGKNLADHDREIIELVRSQLTDDWREPLLKKLEQLLQKYS